MVPGNISVTPLLPAYFQLMKNIFQSCILKILNIFLQFFLKINKVVIVKNNIIDVVLLSLLLTWNIFHIFFLCFSCEMFAGIGCFKNQSCGMHESYPKIKICSQGRKAETAGRDNLLREIFRKCKLEILEILESFWSPAVSVEQLAFKFIFSRSFNGFYVFLTI